jgi:hypothetical protein
VTKGAVAPAAADSAAAPAAAPTSYEEGTYTIVAKGKGGGEYTIEVGKYETDGSGSYGYWEIDKTGDGSFSDIDRNGSVDGHSILTIKNGDVGKYLVLRGPNTWTAAKS